MPIHLFGIVQNHLSSRKRVFLDGTTQIFNLLSLSSVLHLVFISSAKNSTSTKLSLPENENETTDFEVRQNFSTDLIAKLRMQQLIDNYFFCVSSLEYCIFLNDCSIGKSTGASCSKAH